MASHKSPLKQIRKDKKRNLRNRQVRSALKTAVKKIYSASTTEEKKGTYRNAVKLIDKAAQKKVIHWKTASRKKSRLALFIDKSEKQTT